MFGSYQYGSSEYGTSTKTVLSQIVQYIKKLFHTVYVSLRIKKDVEI